MSRSSSQKKIPMICIFPSSSALSWVKCWYQAYNLHVFGHLVASIPVLLNWLRIKHVCLPIVGYADWYHIVGMCLAIIFRLLVSTCQTLMNQVVAPKSTRAWAWSKFLHVVYVDPKRNNVERIIFPKKRHSLTIIYILLSRGLYKALTVMYTGLNMLNGT